MNRYVLSMSLLIVVDFCAVAMEPERTRNVQGIYKDSYGNSPVMRVQLRSGKIVYYQNGQQVNPPVVKKPRREKLEQVTEQSEPQSQEERTGRGYGEER
jgi:hypothetical protein